MEYMSRALDAVAAWRAAAGPVPGHPALIPDPDRLDAAWNEFSARMAGSYPFHHPRYAGQMLKPPHPVAIAAYTAAMHVNPNNHALDGGPETSRMEKEAVAALAEFFGFPAVSLGHLTASGTIANLEALWVARNEHPGKGVAFSRDAHYTHGRMCGVLGMESYPLDFGDPAVAEKLREMAPVVGTLVVTMGTTGLGRVEPLADLLPLCRELGIRVHVDAAYGGFFHALRHSGLVDPKDWEALSLADSLVVDPHKHGLQPYGCGCVLFQDPRVGRYYKHDSPYTYFTSDELHLGEISLECSRAGAAAAALWFTLQVLPLEGEGGMSAILADCRKAAMHFAKSLEASQRWELFARPELDIVAYYPSPTEPALSAISRRCQRIMARGMDAEPQDRLYVSLFSVTAEAVAARHPELDVDVDRVSVLRSVLMKPEHRLFVPELMSRLGRLADAVG